MFATIKMVFVFATLGLVAGVVGIPYSAMVGNVRVLYRVVMRIISTGIRVAGIRVEVRGLEHVPAGVSCIFLSNHVSNLDPPIIFPVLPGQSSVLLKKSLMKIPLLGTAMRLAKFVPVDRGNRREAAKASVEAAAESLKAGQNMLIFAEGTRSKDGRLAAFKRGPFYLAMETGAPIVPMTISGTEKMMRKHSAAILPGVAKVEFLAAIDPAGFATREELMEAVRGAMVAALPEEMRPVQVPDSEPDLES
jgi:1-acyl-sn-glycerol-3-phosphate acyltransferase